MNRIEKLTPDQLTLLPQQRDKWIKAGLSTEPANRQRAEEGVRKAYRAAGLEPPRVIIWLDSPLAGAYGQALTGVLLSELAKRPQDQVGTQVWDQVWTQVRDQVRTQVGDQVWTQVGDQVRAQVGTQVGDQVRNWGSGLVSGYYQHVWSAWFDTMRQVGVQNLEPWEGMQEIAESAGWIWVYRSFCILTERPVELHRDAQGRLHNESGPAVLYRDGFGVWAWHGVRVPQDMIETDWSVDQILREPNSEIRRCAIEKIGWDRLVDSMGLTPVATSPDPGNPGQVIDLYDLPRQVYDEPVRLIVVANGTVESDGRRRRFGLTVPAEISDPVAAAAWTYDVPKEMYLTIAARR